MTIHDVPPAFEGSGQMAPRCVVPSPDTTHIAKQPREEQAQQYATGGSGQAGARHVALSGPLEQQVALASIESQRRRTLELHAGFIEAGELGEEVAPHA